MLGHSSIRITGDIYSRVLIEMQEEAIQKLDLMLGKQETKIPPIAEDEELKLQNHA